MRLRENHGLSMETALPQKAGVHQGSVLPQESEEVDLAIVKTDDMGQMTPR